MAKPFILIERDELERKLHDDRPDLYQLRAERLAEQAQDDFDADLRVIGWGLAAAYLFVVIFRLAQLGVL